LLLLNSRTEWNTKIYHPMKRVLNKIAEYHLLFFSFLDIWCKFISSHLTRLIARARTSLCIYLTYKRGYTENVEKENVELWKSRKKSRKTSKRNLSNISSVKERTSKKKYKEGKYRKENVEEENIEKMIESKRMSHWSRKKMSTIYMCLSYQSVIGYLFIVRFVYIPL